MAYNYYLKAAQRGHIRGAIQVADIWNTGISGLVNRRPSDAVLLVTHPLMYFTSHFFSPISYFEISFHMTAGGSSGQLNTMDTWAASYGKPWIPI